MTPMRKCAPFVDPLRFPRNRQSRSETMIRRRMVPRPGRRGGKRIVETASATMTGMTTDKGRGPLL